MAFFPSKRRANGNNTNTNTNTNTLRLPEMQRYSLVRLLETGLFKRSTRLENEGAYFGQVHSYVLDTTVLLVWADFESNANSSDFL
jgi:hypothetical protein